MIERHARAACTALAAAALLLAGTVGASAAPRDDTAADRAPARSAAAALR
ncbi:S1 family peptidase, partial [Streptomyces bambusae]|nr:S1 family peptidase [Streptomyces bambusae]